VEKKKKNVKKTKQVGKWRLVFSFLFSLCVSVRARALAPRLLLPPAPPWDNCDE
jgi:hypothetical protein